MSLTLEKQEDWFELALKAASSDGVHRCPYQARLYRGWSAAEDVSDDDDDDVDDIEPEEDDEDADIVLPPTKPEDDPFDDFR